jgi:hypothetical protein
MRPISHRCRTARPSFAACAATMSLREPIGTSRASVLPDTAGNSRDDRHSFVLCLVRLRLSTCRSMTYDRTENGPRSPGSGEPKQGTTRTIRSHWASERQIHGHGLGHVGGRATGWDWVAFGYVTTASLRRGPTGRVGGVHDESGGGLAAVGCRRCHAVIGDGVNPPRGIEDTR